MSYYEVHYEVRAHHTRARTQSHGITTRLRLTEPAELMGQRGGKGNRAVALSMGKTRGASVRCSRSANAHGVGVACGAAGVGKNTLRGACALHESGLNEAATCLNSK